MRQKIISELKDAMKAGDKVKVGVLRMAQAGLKDKDIEARGQGREPISDDDILALFQKMIKQRLESAEIYGKAGRTELEQQERSEADIIASFLPKQLDEAEVREAINAAITEIGAATLRDMGKVIGVLKAKYSGQMDFARASALVKEMLPKG